MGKQEFVIKRQSYSYKLTDDISAEVSKYMYIYSGKGLIGIQTDCGKFSMARQTQQKSHTIQLYKTYPQVVLNSQT